MSKSKGKQQKNITILYGLPGSGKSFFAQQFNAPTVDFDAIIKSHGPNKFAVLKELNKQTDLKLIRCYYFNRSDSIIIDGLITTNQQLRDLIDSFTNYFQKYQLIFKLVYWNEDREACLHNDKNRRAISSEVTIKSLPYEIPCFANFPELSLKRIQPMKVVRKDYSIVWISQLLRELSYPPNEIDAITTGMHLISASWCLGGISRTWDDQTFIIEEETPPEFNRLDELLRHACKNITPLDYRQIKSICCDVVQFYESDYYGGSTKNAFHVCDLKNLYECLLNRQLIDE